VGNNLGSSQNRQSLLTKASGLLMMAVMGELMLMVPY